ncbi:MAG: hypothetical protein ACRDD7_09440 [Peptostreptococcaceae bacterium]
MEQDHKPLTTVKLHLNNDTTWTYKIEYITTEHIYMRDTDYTQLRLDRATNRLYNYDEYDRFWKFMKNYSAAITGYEVE